MIIEDGLFPLIMDNAPSLVFVKDEASVILYANKAFFEVYPPERRERIIGYTTVEEFAPEEVEAFLAEDRRALELGDTELIEEITTYTGRKRVFLSRKIGFRTAAGERRLLGISNDITDLSEREKSLVELNKQLQAFSALAAHDLRSPLSTFISAMHLIKRDKTTVLSEKSARYLEMMISSATNLAENIAALLLVSRGDSDADSLHRQSYDLNLMLTEVKFNLARAIRDSGARIYSNRLPSIAVEPALFRQLFQNLVENSIKYRSQTADLKIVIKHTLQADVHVFTIEDNGVGVARQAVSKVFDLYEQDRQKGVSGVGLGLALCKKIVTMHGGRIWIDPAFDQGCLVVLEIPADVDGVQGHHVVGDDGLLEVRGDGTLGPAEEAA